MSGFRKVFWGVVTTGTVADMMVPKGSPLIPGIIKRKKEGRKEEKWREK